MHAAKQADRPEAGGGACAGLAIRRCMLTLEPPRVHSTAFCAAPPSRMPSGVATAKLLIAPLLSLATEQAQPPKETGTLQQTEAV